MFLFFMGVVKFDSLLNDFLKRAGIKKQIEGALILDKFKEVMREMFKEEYSEERTDEILKEMNPLYWKNRALTVACLNPSLSQELKLREKTILYRLNSRIGQDQVDKIIFVL